jgi:ribonuclease HII
VQYPSFSLEFELLKRYSFVSGVDEVGRGCLAGPVVSCIAVITHEDQYLPRVRDSKTMSHLQREKLASELKDTISYYSVGLATSNEIDRLGIRRATHLSMLRAYWKLPVTPEVILMDGESATIPIFSKTFQYNHGDLNHYSIAAASIIAKVYRDTLMIELEKQSPGYHFDEHKGYGTAKHYEAIKKLGISSVHRLSFLKSLSRH